MARFSSARHRRPLRLFFGAAIGLTAATACYPGPIVTAPEPTAPVRIDPAPVHQAPAPAGPAASDAPSRATGAAPSPSATVAAPRAGAARTLIVPVKGIDPSRVRDTFSASRGARTHNALDIMAPRGTPVLAADSGRILRLSRNPAGGITIYQRSADEQWVYYYAHLERYRDGLKEGEMVRQGDVIAYVGTTGNAPPDVPHLHFQVMRWQERQYWNGEPVNAHAWLVRQNPFVIGRR